MSWRKSEENQELLKKIETLEEKNRLNSRALQSFQIENQQQKNIIQEMNQRLLKLEGEQIKINAYEELKQACVFGARLTVNGLCSTNSNFVNVNTCLQTFHASKAFDTVKCRFVAPVDGDYFMDLGLRQKAQEGAVEVMLVISKASTDKKPPGATAGVLSASPDADRIHAYIGSTSGPNSVCHKTMVLSLKQGTTVHPVARCTSGNATICWVAFHGFMITASDKWDELTRPYFGDQDA